MKNVIVTGGTRGLGLAICSRLVLDHYRVVMTGRKPGPDALKLLNDRNNAGRIHFRRIDQSDTASIRPLIKNIYKEFGSFYGLINNAAIGCDSVLATMHDSNIEQLVRINVLSTLLITKYVCRYMLLSGGGRIINIASIVASTGFNGLSVYAATKASLVGFTRSLARELGRADITVNSISPGYMQTDMTDSIRPAHLTKIQGRSPLKRLVLPSEVASAIAYLLGPEAASVTGIDLTMDAGSTA
jgi:3-oxoacyl-[acyl-carrier protein] reductase